MLHGSAALAWSSSPCQPRLGFSPPCECSQAFSTAALRLTLALAHRASRGAVTSLLVAEQGRGRAAPSPRSRGRLRAGFEPTR